MAQEKWHMPDIDQPDRHAKDIALLVKKYTKELTNSRLATTTNDTTQQTTLRKTQESRPTRSQTQPEHTPSDAVVQETQQHTFATTWSSQSSIACSTQGKGMRAFRQVRILVREDTSERLQLQCAALPTPISSAPELLPRSSSDTSTEKLDIVARTKRHSFTALISRPASKRRKILRPLDGLRANQHVDDVEFDEQKKIIHVYAKDGVRVEVHKEEEE